MTSTVSVFITGEASVLDCELRLRGTRLGCFNSDDLAQNSPLVIKFDVREANGTPLSDISSEHEDDRGYPCRLRDESEVYDFRRSIVVTVNGFLPAPPERAKGRKQPAPTKLAPTKIVLEDIYLAVVSMDDLLAKSLNAL
ncbi:MAG: hypothetical protein CYPHOPRED_005494 [Cyphobasidiales sp. Tagirdzhanova-0007]|nr:MAG: hypothetical protein CYPHOPRED_005494 [Cyphobasidiales sp. Tagirdzhanova-0007]